jgi:16S rRNA (guanine966-N2)-methyltransferase
MGRPGSSNQLRIIGGKWRGRKLKFAEGRGLRPTPDRVRETLFNWLMPVVEGARCLDLFTGSGALGLECLSRGAREVVMIDNNPRVIEQLRKNLALLDNPAAQLVLADGLKWLQQQKAEPFDIVFLDPPYADQVLPDCFKVLEERGWLKADAWVYIEFPSNQELPTLPGHWQWHRNKRAGQVGYHLARRQAS